MIFLVILLISVLNSWSQALAAVLAAHIASAQHYLAQYARNVICASEVGSDGCTSGDPEMTCVKYFLVVLTHPTPYCHLRYHSS